MDLIFKEVYADNGEFSHHDINEKETGAALEPRFVIESLQTQLTESQDTLKHRADIINVYQKNQTEDVKLIREAGIKIGELETQIAEKDKLLTHRHKGLKFLHEAHEHLSEACFNVAEQSKDKWATGYLNQALAESIKIVDDSMKPNSAPQ